MTTSDDSPDDSDLQLVLDALADAECREIFESLEEPSSAREVAERCELPRTSAYRKLEALSKAGLVREGTKPRPDGHHETTYQRVIGGAVVLLKQDSGLGLELVREPNSADQQLSQL